ncbi:MAG: hypothetical protein JXJ04_26850, partial [Spirochaetales bacterium]|nr:hypothetical protein [Spirochaetales bacterium]
MKNIKNAQEHDDNLEFEKEIIEELIDTDIIEEEAISSTKGISLNKKKALCHRAKESNLSVKQQYEFIAGVELDLLRDKDNRLGIEELFNVYCTKGSRYWLNPLHDISRIDDILLKFAGKGKIRITILRQLVELLIDLGNEGINPTAFLKYVIVSRLQGDNNFRKWQDNHFMAFRLISHILKDMGEKSPFDREVLGNKINRLTKDIVLVKYAGKPLSRFPEHQLSDKSLNKRYMEAWGKLNLDNSFTILFLKTNILHFMYVMSGKIDYQQLITIIEHLPEIEEGFSINFPDNYFSLDISKIDMNLYNYDIHSSLESRRQKGYKKYDFVLEIKAYLKIILALLNTQSGIYLCGYFARKLTTAKDPE